MQIKTITCHDVYNHGASLQAYALQRYLTNQGHQVEIINYKPWYLSNHHNLAAISNQIFDRFFIRELYLLAKLPGRLINLKRKNAFDHFREWYLKLTIKRFGSNAELKADCPEADAYIAGSDQIWNTLFENGKDPTFYLDFVPPEKKKISYAASFATDKVMEGYEEFVKNSVRQIDFISVREHSGLKLLDTLGIKHAVHVSDPVFLLPAQQWDQVATTNFSEKYLLIYDTEKSNILKQLTLKLAKKLKIPVYSIGTFKQSFAKRNFHLAGPNMFVSLVKNAEFVISNSFHGTAFAIIYEKNLCVVNRSEAINSRMLSLLESMGIEDRLVGADVNIEAIIQPINYIPVRAKLNEFIEHSKQFLNQSIED